MNGAYLYRLGVTPYGEAVAIMNDLAAAHILAVEALLSGGKADQFNVGTGTGYSVREVIAAVEEVTGLKVPVQIGARREGDPPSLVASSEKLRRTLGWEPRYTDIRDVIRHAWGFQRGK